MSVSTGTGRVHEGRLFDPYGAHRDDLYAFLAGIEGAEPVFYAPLLDAWCVTRREDMLSVLRDDRSFSARDHNPRPAVALPEDVRQMFHTWRGTDKVGVGSLDPPEHGRVREVLNAGFTPARILEFEPTMRSIATGLAERVAARSEFDLSAAFAVPYALEVICRRVGIPDEYIDSCRLWSEQRIELMMLRGDADPEKLREYGRGLMAFGAFARFITHERLASPQNDLISELLHDGKGGRTLTPDEVSVQVPTLIFAGHMTVAEALGTILFQQLRSPGGWAAVVDGSIATRDLVEEGLRFDSPLAGMYRTATRDVTVGGVRLAEGSRLLLLYGAAGRDSRSHKCPAAFAPGTQSASHLAFGHGIHFCLGSGFARAELDIAIQVLAEKMPVLTLASDLPPRHRPVFPLRALTELPVRQTTRPPRRHRATGEKTVSDLDQIPSPSLTVLKPHDEVQVVGQYYDDKTARLIRKYGPGPRIHYHVGYYPSTETPRHAEATDDSFRQSIRLRQEDLLRFGAEIWDAGQRLSGKVLDIGCGLGGGSIFWAQEYGADVTSVTNAPEHPPLINEFAREAGVDGRIRTLVGDANRLSRLPLTDGTYDAAVAIESSGYFNRPQWFEGLSRLLRPGASVCIEDVFLARPRGADVWAEYFYTKPASVQEYVEAARSAGFEMVDEVDATKETAPFWDESAAWTKAVLDSDNSLSPVERRQLRISLMANQAQGVEWLAGGLRLCFLRFEKK